MIRAKAWNSKALKGAWLVTYKIDGVRARFNGKTVLSRRNKQLYNLDHLRKEIGNDAEIFLGDFKRTIQAVRTQHEVEPVTKKHVYRLDPVDTRLLAGTLIDPLPCEIQRYLNDAVKAGYEGIVLRSIDKWVKVVARPTLDLRILGFFEGDGKYKGMLGGFITKRGKVGSGFIDSQRKGFWKERFKLKNRVIECSYKELTVDGMLRQGVFKRLREDK